MAVGVTRITPETSTGPGAIILPGAMTTIGDQTADTAVTGVITSRAVAAATDPGRLAMGGRTKNRTGAEVLARMATHGTAQSSICLEGMVLMSRIFRLFCSRRSTGTSWAGLRARSRKRA